MAFDRLLYALPWCTLRWFKLCIDVQICLAAEKCGSLSFDVRNDMWHSQEGFLCDVQQISSVTYWGLLKKVQLCLNGLTHTCLHSVRRVCAIGTL